MKLRNKLSVLLILLVYSSIIGANYYVSPSGNDTNSGDQNNPFKTITQAINTASSGDTIYLRAGNHDYSSTIVITKNGSSSNTINVFAYANETPVINFNMSENSSNRGVVLDGDNWHWKGIIIQGAGDNGMLLSGNNNTIENCIFRNNSDTGLQLSRYNTSANSISQWPSNNLILGCEAYDNRDSGNEDADGFAAKLTCGTGNVFRNCVAHHNIDDGWDLYTKSDTGPIGIIVLEDCIAHNNGSLTDGSTSGNGDKNGYKLGSSAHNINHIIRRCIAYNNGKHGFADNGNVGSMEFSNNTSYNNEGYNFHTRDGANHVFKNNLSFGNTQNDRLRGDFSAPNTFINEEGGFTVNNSDFVTLDPGPNNAPISNGFLNLASSSDLIDAGVTTSGITYNGSSPDLGAVEFDGTTNPVQTYTLSVNTQGQGSVNPNGGTYNQGTSVTLTASPASGWSFSNWSGDASGSGSSATVVMNSNRLVTAVFVEDGNTNSGTGEIIEDDDTRTISYDGSLKSYGNANNAQAINLSNNSGERIVWNYNTTSAGTYTITLRYTRKASMNTSVDMIINGVSQTVSLAETNSSEFTTTSFTVNLNSGNNEIILETNSSGESADIDYIQVSGDSGGTDPGNGGDDNIVVSARGIQGGEIIEIRANGATLETYTLTTSYQDYTATGSGTIQVHFVNDNGPLDVQVDYAIIDGVTYQSEDQEINTGVWQGQCGGTLSEFIHCSGYIEYSNGSGDPNPITYTLATTTNPSNGGSVSLSPSGGTYNDGTVVTITASPSNGFTFGNWSGDASGTSITTTVTMNGNKNVTAVFNEIPTQATTITLQENEAGYCGVDGSVDDNNGGFTGDGFANTDNSSGNGVDWAINGEAGNYTFTWRYANGSSSNRTGVLSINGAAVSTVDFNSTGNWTSWNTASVTINNVSAGLKTIRLEANQGSGLGNIDNMEVTGVGVSGANCDGSGGGDPIVTYTLSTSANPSNGGSVSLSPSGGTYNEGTVVTITASANSGYTFGSWSGDASGSSITTTITMNGNKSVTAQFNTDSSGGDGGTGTANYDIVGWATQAGGTTGGQGGTSITCATGDCILAAIKDKKDGVISQPLIIYVNGTVTPSNTSATKIDIKEVRDVSVIGVGTSGLFDGIGLKVYKAGNIIIQNVTVRKVNIGDKDAISIEGPADHIWVDHCELYAEYQNVGKDFYDGLLDAKRDAEYITYSYNYLHDSWKTMLVGSSESDTYDRKITAHHNYFENCNSRLPLFRGGQGHFFNNYYEDIVSTGINSRIGACLRVENNYFKGSNNPIVSAYSDVLGAVDESGTIYENCTFDYSNSDVSEPNTCTATIPYSYTNSLNSTSDVPSIVVANAGVGKIGNSSRTSNNATKKLSIEDTINQFSIYPNPVKGNNLLTLSIPNFTGKESIKIINMLGMEILTRNATSSNDKVNVSHLPSGQYIIQLKSVDGYFEIRKFIKQ